jgi:hypothetical protein
MGLELSLTIGASEEASLIYVLVQLDDKCSFKSCLREDDGRKSPFASVRRALVQSVRYGDPFC